MLLARVVVPYSALAKNKEIQREVDAAMKSGDKLRYRIAVLDRKYYGREK